MKKPSFTETLGRKSAAEVEDKAAAKAKQNDGRINTTLRISPEGLEALKVVAAAKRMRVNDLVLEGVEYVLALNGRKMQLRK